MAKRAQERHQKPSLADQPIRRGAGKAQRGQRYLWATKLRDMGCRDGIGRIIGKHHAACRCDHLRCVAIAREVAFARGQEAPIKARALGAESCGGGAGQDQRTRCGGTVSASGMARGGTKAQKDDLREAVEEALVLQPIEKGDQIG